MRVVSLREAKARFSPLIEQAAAGEEIVITKRGKPVARLMPLAGPEQRRVLGRLRGTIAVPDDFDEMDAEGIQKLFEEGC